MVPKDHVRVVGNTVEIGLPELRVGQEARVDVTVAGDQLEVLLGELPPAPAPAETHVTVEVALDPKHPGWGFADPAFATTTRTTATFSPDGRTQEVVGGAPPQGVETLAPGSFSLVMPGGRLAAWASPGVTVSYSTTGVRWDAPQGGEARWRVASAAGEPVIPDAKTYFEGLDWRFTNASFPEPAVPAALASERDPEALIRALYGEVRALLPGWLPGTEALRPRPLNRAWRSGWATSVERALILHRMLGQSRILAGWLLTGAEAEYLTLTGYDYMLVAARIGERDVLLDPTCPVCAFDEVSTRVAGHPAVGSATVVPLSPGRLTRTLSLAGEEYQANIVATGAAALYLREQVWGLGETRAAEVLCASVGLPGGVPVEVVGLDVPGSEVRIKATSRHSPVAPFDGDPPWDGGWADE
jgi:hypothetical protein